MQNATSSTCDNRSVVIAFTSEGYWTEVDASSDIDMFSGNSGIRNIPNLDEGSLVNDFFTLVTLS